MAGSGPYKTRSDTLKLQRLISTLKERGSEVGQALETTAHDFLGDVKKKKAESCVYEGVPHYDPDNDSDISSFVGYSDEEEEWGSEWEEDTGETQPQPPKDPTPPKDYTPTPKDPTPPPKDPTPPPKDPTPPPNDPTKQTKVPTPSPPEDLTPVLQHTLDIPPNKPLRKKGELKNKSMVKSQSKDSYGVAGQSNTKLTPDCKLYWIQKRKEEEAAAKATKSTCEILSRNDSPKPPEPILTPPAAKKLLTTSSSSAGALITKMSVDIVPVESIPPATAILTTSPPKIVKASEIEPDKEKLILKFKTSTATETSIQSVPLTPPSTPVSISPEKIQKKQGKRGMKITEESSNIQDQTIITIKKDIEPLETTECSKLDESNFNFSESTKKQESLISKSPPKIDNENKSKNECKKLQSESMAESKPKKEVQFKEEESNQSTSKLKIESAKKDGDEEKLNVKLEIQHEWTKGKIPEYEIKMNRSEVKEEQLKIQVERKSIMKEKKEGSPQELRCKKLDSPPVKKVVVVEPLKQETSPHIKNTPNLVRKSFSKNSAPVDDIDITGGKDIPRYNIGNQRSRKPTLASQWRKNKQKVKERVNEDLEHKTRLESFSSWPIDAPVSSTDLASAGFSYLSTGKDSVQCSTCGLILSNWSEMEDSPPIIQHCINSPECVYVQRVQGTQWVIDVLKKSTN